MLTVSRSAVDLSGLGGIWDGPSHSGNVYCGQMNQYFRYFLGGMDAVCPGPLHITKSWLRRKRVRVLDWWATVRGLRCRILRFKMHHTFSIGDRSGLQAGQSSTRTLFLRSQDFVMCAECGFALSCWNMHGRPWKRCLLEGSILCSKISMYFSALMVPSQKCKLPLPRALTQPHTMTDPGFWTCCW